MLSTRLITLGAIAAALVLVIVIGSAALALGDSFKQVHRARKERAEREAESPPPPRPRKVRYTPERTRLRWYSPEIIAVLLLTLAAGLWLARLVGQ
jgi:hypothetical protein